MYAVSKVKNDYLFDVRVFEARAINMQFAKAFGEG